MLISVLETLESLLTCQTREGFTCLVVGVVGVAARLALTAYMTIKFSLSLVAFLAVFTQKRSCFMSIHMLAETCRIYEGLTTKMTRKVSLGMSALAMLFKPNSRRVASIAQSAVLLLEFAV